MARVCRVEISMSGDKKTPDWIAIEGLYKSGDRSLRAIAEDHGIAEATIRARAKKNGWVRDAVGTVRRQVNDHIAGVAQGVAQDAVRKMMNDAAQSGIADMEMGLSNARKVLWRIHLALSVSEEEFIANKELKILNEANAGAIETIRRIRQLDTPGMTSGGAVVFNVGGKETTLEQLGW